jgi:hypothetical protein
MTVVNEAAIHQDIKQWSGLVLTGAWVALASVVLIVVQVAIYLLWPTPETTRGLFEVLIQNPLRGLLALDLLYIVSNLLAYLLYFALSAVLWRVSRSAVVIALAFGVLGMAAYMASPRPVEMLMLAQAYAEADAAGQLALLATGEGMRATWMGTAFDIYYLFNLVTLLILAVLMYRSEVFTKATAVWGLVAATLMAVPSNFGTVGVVFAMASLVPWAVFAVLVARRLFALAASVRSRGTRYTIAMITHEQPGTTFWDRVRAGVEQAAKNDNVELKYSNDPQQANQATLASRLAAPG